MKETAAGYNFNLSHRASEPKVFLEMETPTRWRVVELSPKLLQLQATLGDHGLTVPRDMRERVASLLSEANPTVPSARNWPISMSPPRRGTQRPSCSCSGAARA